MNRTVALFGTLLLSTLAANADSLVTVRPAGTDTLNWSQFGPSTTISNPFTFTTTGGFTGTGSYATGPGTTAVEALTWGGNFTAGDVLNWTQGSGAITLNFSQGYTQIGAQIQSDFYGDFTARICDVNGCFSEAGTSTASNDGSAIFIGISSSTPINSVTFDLTSASNAPEDFAINTVTLDGTPASVTPEPSSFVLLGTGLAGVLGSARRKLAARSIKA